MPAFIPLAITLLVSAAFSAPHPAAAQEVSPDETVTTILRQIGATQTDRDVAAIRRQEGATILTDPDTGQVLAAVSPRSALGRALNPIGPGCSTTSLCMRSSAGVPYGYSGTGARSGT
ncbi:hypothetical protein AABM26_03895 [Curtobacterium aetherium]|uniref:hypothetical protein n=1 Tax=Curtobacterium aetherium TaxID=2841594 RepID=UPI003B52A781